MIQRIHKLQLINMIEPATKTKYDNRLYKGFNQQFIQDLNMRSVKTDYHG